MTQEEKQLLLKDICARLPYQVIVKIFDESILLEECNNEKGTLYGKETMSDDYFVIKCNNDSWIISCEDFKPYLRPMSSMTEEEFINLTTATELQYNQLELVEWDNNCKTLEFYLSEIPHYCVIKVFDWLNAHQFDYRGLIPMGLALEAKEGMYDRN